MNIKKFVRSFGKFPKELEPYEGQEVTIYPEGIDPITGILRKGHFGYTVTWDEGMFQLYAGYPVKVKTRDGNEIDLSIQI